jgi:preprotein translocase subunit SecA
LITPTQSQRLTHYKKPAKLLTGLDAFVDGVAGRVKRLRQGLTELRHDAESVDAQAAEWSKLTDHHLRERLVEFREKFRRDPEPDKEVVLSALGAIREVSERQTGMRPYVVQLMGALALYRGFLAEMATGEGKTLTAGLAAVMVGWSRRPCHIVTVNDYLVQRDAEWLGPLYRFCGAKVGHVTGQIGPEERKRGYNADVTYTTSKELLADFLRDRLALGELQNPTRRLLRHLIQTRPVATDGLVQRGLHTVIVDEADSVLIDEAVTPLIISMHHENEFLRSAVMLAHEIAGGLEQGRDYTVNWRYREVELTPEGQRAVEQKCHQLPGFWRGVDRREELIRQSLSARELFRPGREYLVSDGKVMIVDEFTGRVMPNRTWREGMHQAIEAKENIEVTSPSETVARMSFQRFFRCFYRMAGMTGTASEAAGEFWQIYRLPVVTIPTNRPCIRQQWPDKAFADEESKWTTIVEEIGRIHQSGRPLLVGTRSVAASEHLAHLLRERGFSHRVLNAARDKEEAQIIAEAGEPSRITIATNMAGRGTDIKLGKGVQALGGLHVIATERHESGRVDRQLFGRSGRQGDPGSAQACISMGDELVRRFVPERLRNSVKNMIRTRTPGWEKAAGSVVTVAQRSAQRLAFKQRRNVLRTDTWLEEALSFTGNE